MKKTSIQALARIRVVEQAGVCITSSSAIDNSFDNHKMPMFVTALSRTCLTSKACRMTLSPSYGKARSNFNSSQDMKGGYNFIPCRWRLLKIFSVYFRPLQISC
ncbi:hypothetical protein Pyn_27999 [Prunus yedoensis var. nudiflora]|uniref:Uncharacterized protein n=1 Tax=Prunus yedoensis var. nudiflora TaxID=2094558 RepID=A0A314Y641_PRUYE|nr:hypothetical protein Pyn_27999 [Prunus yedoensis var. nudiflora]